MVTTIMIIPKTKNLFENSNKATLPLIIEIVGPAGVGKTTLLNTLLQRNQDIVTDLNISKIHHLIVLLNHILTFFPTYFNRFKSTRWFTVREFRSMVYLVTWIKIIKQYKYSQYSSIVFDHGPIYRLAMLREFGPIITKSNVYKKWWNHLFDQWTNILDIIILLDAKNELLIKRIQSRQRYHYVKGKSNQEKIEFLIRYRKSYQYVIEKMTSNQGPRLLQFDTSKKSPVQIVEELLKTLEVR